MSVPTSSQVLEALAGAGNRSTSWLCSRFEVTGDAEFFSLRAVLDQMAAQTLIKLDTQGTWSPLAAASPT